MGRILKQRQSRIYRKGKKIKEKTKKNKKKTKSNNLIKWILAIAIIAGTVYVVKIGQDPKANPEDALKTYMSYILNKDYEKMYEMLSTETKQKVDKDTYLARNKNIYEGIEISKLDLNIVKTNGRSNKKEIIYQVAMQTVAGEIEFPNTSYLKLEDEEYKLIWTSADIFPDLKDDFKVRVETLEAERGKILDRAGNILAGKQTASRSWTCTW